MIKQSFKALGTKINLTIFDYVSDYILVETRRLVTNYENRLTVNRDHSEVVSINQNAGIRPVKVSLDTFFLIQQAVQASQLGLGFNVAIGPLVKLWQIGFEGAHKPEKKAIEAVITQINPENIILNKAQCSVFLTKKGMALDLGGIAKGYIADCIKTIWLKNHIKSGIIDLGGNILLVGQHLSDNQAWRIGIQNPSDLRHKVVGYIRTSACAIGTSGIYERRLIVGNRTYHHMFDSQTGFPIENSLASVTIVSKLSIDGEIWSTIAFYQGLEAGKRLVESLPNIEAIFITKQNEVVLTSGLIQRFDSVR